MFLNITFICLIIIYIVSLIIKLKNSAAKYLNNLVTYISFIMGFSIDPLTKEGFYFFTHCCLLVLLVVAKVTCSHNQLVRLIGGSPDFGDFNMWEIRVCLASGCLFQDILSHIFSASLPLSDETVSSRTLRISYCAHVVQLYPMLFRHSISTIISAISLCLCVPELSNRMSIPMWQPPSTCLPRGNWKKTMQTSTNQSWGRDRRRLVTGRRG